MGLFGKKKETVKTVKTEATQPSSGPKEATYFGKNLKVTGNVYGSGDLIILGSLDGEFDLKGKLQVAETANITGTVKAGDITVKGNIQGTITAAERVHFDPTARVQGQINSPKISMMEGARFDGDINMSGKIPQPMHSTPAEPSVVSKDPDMQENK
jgi:cytoskeletal protein CcmA (bactofilin family)